MPSGIGVSIAKYEYAWSSTATSQQPGKDVWTCKLTAKRCPLSFEAPSPGSTWNLMARAVDTSGKGGPWFVKPVAVPKGMVTLLIGDSVSSGHNYLTCDFPEYSYGQTLWKERQKLLPAKWQKVHQYVNLAHSGFSTTQVIDASNQIQLNACGAPIATSPLGDAVKLLQANAGGWNLVGVTAGVDDTNWVALLHDIVGEAFLLSEV